jgi:type II secretory pathway pseudopilin PulG
MSKIQRHNAFSLVEVTLALGVVAFALVAILGIVPVGLNSGRESVDASHTGLIAQDVYNRLRTTMVSNDPFSPAYFTPYPTNLNSFFFYTSEGTRTGELLKVAFPNDQPAFYPNVKNAADFYRAKVNIGTFDQSLAFNSYDPRKVVVGTSPPNLLCATVEIQWPVNTQGAVAGGSNKKTTYTFFLRKP